MYIYKADNSEVASNHHSNRILMNAYERVHQDSAQADYALDNSALI